MRDRYSLSRGSSRNQSRFLVRSITLMFLLNVVHAKITNRQQDGRIITPTTHLRPNRDKMMGGRRLSLVGVALTTPGILLNMCEGDCDDDDQCAGDLKCFPRLGNEPVPGCPDSSGRYAGWDFCYDPSISDNFDNRDDANDDKKINELKVAGIGGLPADNFPLAKCEGHCDFDSDCSDDLACFFRDEDQQEIPGCSGQLDNVGIQYCYDPKELNPDMADSTPDDPEDQENSGSPNLDIVGLDGYPPEKYPLAECQGHCDSNSDCKEGLHCYEREPDDKGKFIPGCLGALNEVGIQYCFKPNIEEDNSIPSSPTPDPTASPTPDPTASPTSEPTAAPITMWPTVPDEPTESPNDDDEAPTESPNDDDEAPTASPVLEETPAPNPNPTEIPTASPTPVPSAEVSDEILVLDMVGLGGLPRQKYPLGKCQGHCKGIEDCQEGLRCYERERRDTEGPNIPGCTGELDKLGIQYCYNPDDEIVSDSSPVSAPIAPANDPTVATPTTPSAPVATTVVAPDAAPSQIYSQEILPLTVLGDGNDPASAFPLGRCGGDCDGDYDCDGELICYERQGLEPVPGCSGNGMFAADYCIDPRDSPIKPPTQDAFRLKMFWKKGDFWQEEDYERNWCIECFNSTCAVGQGIEIQSCGALNAFFEFTHEEERGNEKRFHIQIAGTELCLELHGSRTIDIQDCDYELNKQQFVFGRGSLSENMFELEPAKKEGCLQQQHHPKWYEMIFNADCSTARKYDTSMWMKY